MRGPHLLGMMMQDFPIACVQSPPGAVVTPAYADNTLASLDRVALAVFPELCNVPYFPLEPNSGDAGAPIPIDDGLILEFGRVARNHRTYLMMGVFLEDGGAKWNAAILIGPDGRPLEGRTSRGRSALAYRKVHLCDIQTPTSQFYESHYFDAGSEYLVWETPLGLISALICYDRHFPEAWTSVRAMGAEVVGICTTSPTSTEATFVAEMQAMALQQSVFVATSNRVGEEVLQTSGTRTQFLGGSCIVDPHGNVLAKATPKAAEHAIAARLEAQSLDRARRQNEFQERRRPDTYVSEGALSPQRAS